MNNDKTSIFTYLDKGFYSLVQNSKYKIEKRNKLMVVTQYRYKRLLDKTFRAIKQKKICEILRLKFKRIKEYHLFSKAKRRQIISPQLLKIKRIYFDVLNDNAKNKLNQRGIINVILELRSQSQIFFCFNKLKQNFQEEKKIRTFNSDKNLNIKNRCFDLWLKFAVRTQERKSLLKLITKWRFNRLRFNFLALLKTACQISKKQKEQIRIKGQYFTLWRIYQLSQNKSRQSKFKDVHSYFLKQFYFSFLKKRTLFVQKNKLATEFYKFKQFQKWKDFLTKIKQKNIKLNSLEAKIIDNHPHHLKLIYFKMIHNLWEKRILQRELINDIEQVIKAKEIERMIKLSFISLKNNVKVNKIRKLICTKLLRKIFLILKASHQGQNQKKRDIVQYFENIREQQLRKVFSKFKESHKICRNKINLAQAHYQKNLQSSFLYLWMGLVVEKYQSKLEDANLFYSSRRKIFIFAALRDYCDKNQERRMIHLVVLDFVRTRLLKRQKKLFHTFAAFTRASIKRSSYFKQLKYKAFYSWRLFKKIIKFQ